MDDKDEKVPQYIYTCVTYILLSIVILSLGPSSKGKKTVILKKEKVFVRVWVETVVSHEEVTREKKIKN